MSHAQSMPYFGPTQQGLTIPADMICTPWLQDTNGKTVVNPVLSLEGLQKVQLWFTVENKSKLEAVNFNVFAELKIQKVAFFDPDPNDPDNPNAPGASPLDILPANTYTIQGAYAAKFAVGPLTLKPPAPPQQPKANIATVFAREIGFYLPMSSSWDSGAGKGNLVLHLAVDVGIESLKKTTLLLTVVHHNLL